MHYVYRIQDAEGRGPFKPGFSASWSERDKDHMPNWLSEFGPIHLNYSQDYVCGSACKTLSGLRKWFSKKEYQTLKRFGYRAFKVQVDLIAAESDIQLFVASRKPFTCKAKKVKLY